MRKNRKNLLTIDKKLKMNGEIENTIIIPSYNRYGKLYALLRDLENQTSSEKFKIIIILTGKVDHHNIAEINKFKIDSIVVIGKTNWWWTKSVSIGINLSITEYQNAKNFLLINDDVQILDDYLENMQFEIKNLPKKTIIYSMIKEKANPALFLETGTIFDKKIKKDTVVPRTRYVKRDLCTARGTFYPRDLFLEKNIFFNYRLFPHHYADMMLSHRAVRKGYNIIGMKEIFILSENNFSSEFSSKNYFERYFGKSSPQRIWSVLLFWILYWI